MSAQRVSCDDLMPMLAQFARYSTIALSFGMLLVACVSGPITAETTTAETIAVDDFSDGMSAWTAFAEDYARLVQEPGTRNTVLELTPQPRAFSYVLLNGSQQFRNIRMEGRFQFPTEGDGYLGFIYNYQKTDDRVDFGCIYVKSNGSYLRMSPHYDGNPSWRLHEQDKVRLEGERRIEVGRWYRFRLDVTGHRAQLYIDDMELPLATFDRFDQSYGALGLEARPGGGEPVWVDDVRVSRLDAAPPAPAPAAAPDRGLNDWQVLGPLLPPETDLAAYPELPETGWQPFAPDRRGALITGALTQFSSGDRDTLYLRVFFDAGETPQPGWLAFSSANRLDVWLNGFYRGSVAPDRYIWSDFLSAAEHPGAQLPMLPSAGRNEVLVRVHGRRFAGGGFFAGLRYPD